VPRVSELIAEYCAAITFDSVVTKQLRRPFDLIKNGCCNSTVAHVAPLARLEVILKEVGIP